MARPRFPEPMLTDADAPARPVVVALPFGHAARTDRVGVAVAPPRLPADRPRAAPACDDPRWVLAARAASTLEGGRAAILTPENRRRLMDLAARMGLRPFDASLVIAIVQDAARTGRDPGALALGRGVADRLRFVAAASPLERPRDVLVPLIVSVVLAAVAFIAVLGWLNQA